MPAGNVFTLYRGGQRAAALYESGINRVADIPPDTRLTGRQSIQREAAVSNRPQINHSAVRLFLRQLCHPLSFLDFETYATASPLFDGLRPYQQVPFQFSCHIVWAPGTKPKARGHIVKHASDPRTEFMEQLRTVLPATGSIIVYNAGFEKGRLAECAEFLPQFKPWVRKLQPRFVDLLEPFQGFHYYHPDQHGSASIKAVLPVLTRLSYEKLGIRDGTAAAQRFMEVTFGKASPEERKRVWADLKKYCGLDTRAMVELVRALQELALAEINVNQPRQNKGRKVGSPRRAKRRKTELKSATN